MNHSAFASWCALARHLANIFDIADRDLHVLSLHLTNLNIDRLFLDYLFTIRLDLDNGLFLDLLFNSHNRTGTKPSLTQLTIPTLPPHRQTNRLPKANQQIVDVMPLVPRQPTLQRRSCLLRILRFVPTPQVRDTVHMYVDADAFIAAPCSAECEVCHLWTNAGKRHKAGYCVGDVGGELVAQNFGSLLDVFGFEVVEADFVDQGIQLRGVDGEDGFEVEALGLLAIAGCNGGWDVLRLACSLACCALPRL